MLLARLVERRPGGVQLRALGGGRAGEVRLGRFLRNPRVTPGEMVGTARARTLARVAGLHVLAVQDTTSLRDDGDQRSLHLHPTIAVDAEDGSLLGLVDAQFLARAGGKKASKGRRAFDEKESRRWLEATASSAGLLAAGAASVTVVADREGDVYEEFARRPAGVELVIRAQQDRALADGRLLSRALDGVAELGREAVALPAGPGRRARKAVLALRAAPVRIKAPKRCAAAAKREAGAKAGAEAGAALPDEVALWFVEAREVEPPAAGPGAAQQGAHWLLLTTRPVATLDAARRVTATYRQRWTIEQLFRTMKTRGFGVEASQVGEGGPFENLATATLVAAVQVLQMVRERDGAAGRPLSDAFDPSDQPAMAAISAALEGKTERQRNPHPHDTLAWAAWVCARLGGWNCYGAPPGPITIHNGILRLRAMLQGWRLRDALPGTAQGHARP